MEALTGFAVLSLLSSLLLSLLPETRLKSTVHLVASLLLLLSWLTALQTLCTRFSQPETSASAASPLSETADFSFADAVDALSRQPSAQEDAP